MPESTRIWQNIVIPAVCSHTSSCLIRFDNQKMTAVLTLLSPWQICFSGAVWRLWLQKSLKICLGFRGLQQKRFVGVYRAVQKQQRGLKSQSLSLYLAWVGPTWQLSGPRYFHYHVVVNGSIERKNWKRTLVKQTDEIFFHTVLLSVAVFPCASLDFNTVLASFAFLKQLSIIYWMYWVLWILDLDTFGYFRIFDSFQNLNGLDFNHICSF